MGSHTDDPFGRQSEPRWDRKLAMGGGGASILLGIVALPELVALGLLVWLLFAVETAIRGPE